MPPAHIEGRQPYAMFPPVTYDDCLILHIANINRMFNVLIQSWSVTCAGRTSENPPHFSQHQVQCRLADWNRYCVTQCSDGPARPFAGTHPIMHPNNLAATSDDDDDHGNGFVVAVKRNSPENWGGNDLDRCCRLLAFNVKVLAEQWWQRPLLDLERE